MKWNKIPISSRNTEKLSTNNLSYSGIQKGFSSIFLGHFDEKIMPSAGLLPYAQSLVCSFNNTCHKHEQRDFTMLTGYNGST